MLQLRLPIFI